MVQVCETGIEFRPDLFTLERARSSIDSHFGHDAGNIECASRTPEDRGASDKIFDLLANKRYIRSESVGSKAKFD